MFWPLETRGAENCAGRTWWRLPPDQRAAAGASVTQQIREYWSRFYAGHHTLTPTPFARCVAKQLSTPTLVADIGCGNGRDSIFFAGLGHRVLGLDVAGTAIAGNREVVRQRGIEGVAFEELDLGVHGGLDGVLNRLLTGPGGPDAESFAIYGRFLLHAITEDEEDAVLAALADCLRAGDRCFFEFRTDRDKPLRKQFRGHFRRFVNVEAFLEKVRKARALQCLYCVEGQGMAKYGDEDPFVARIHLGRNPDY